MEYQEIRHILIAVLVMIAIVASGCTIDVVRCGDGRCQKEEQRDYSCPEDCKDTQTNQSRPSLQQDRPETPQAINKPSIISQEDNPGTPPIHNLSEAIVQQDISETNTPYNESDSILEQIQEENQLPLQEDEQQQAEENIIQDFSGEYDLTIEHGGLTRYFYVYIPKASYKEEARPVVFNFHGGFGNGKQQCDMSKMPVVAEEYGFIVVCPDGTPNSEVRTIGSKLLYWNDGEIGTPAELNNVDDVGFVEAMIEHLDQNFDINKNRVYSTGISNGAIFSLRLACEIPDKITAIAPVAGSICNMTVYCNPSRPVPVMMFNGLEDTNVPYDGGLGSGFAKYVFPPVSDSVDFWIEKNGLSYVTTHSGKIGQSARYEIYGSDEEAQVILWTLEDGGHTWPGGNPMLGEKLLGNVNEDISASEEMWKFFDRYSLE